MDINIEEIKTGLENAESFDDLTVVLFTASKESGVKIGDLVAEEDLKDVIESSLEKLGTEKSVFDERIESLSAEQDSELEQTIQEEAQELEQENEELAEELFFTNEKRFKEILSFKQEGDANELYNAILKGDSSVMSKYSLAEVQNLYLLMGKDQQNAFQDSIEGMELSGERKIAKMFKRDSTPLDTAFFVELNELRDEFEEYREHRGIAIEDNEHLTKNAKTLLQRDFESTEKNADLIEKNKFVRAVVEESYQDYFTSDKGYFQNMVHVTNKKGQKVARKTPFGTYCSKDATTEEVFASFVSHIQRKQTPWDKKDPSFHVQLPKDEEKARAIVDKVLFKLVDDGLVELGQLNVPKPYDALLKSKLDARDLSVGIGNEKEIKNNDQDVQHDAKLENGGDKPSEERSEPADPSNKEIQDFIGGDKIKKEEEIISKISEDNDFSENKSKIVLDMFKANLEDGIDDLDVENIAKDALTEFKVSENALLVSGAKKCESYKRALNNLSSNVDESGEPKGSLKDFRKDLNEEMTVLISAKSHDTVFEEKDFLEMFTESVNKIKLSGKHEMAFIEPVVQENTAPDYGHQEMNGFDDQAPPFFDDQEMNGFDDQAPPFFDEQDVYMGHEQPQYEDHGQPQYEQPQYEDHGHEESGQPQYEQPQHEESGQSSDDVVNKKEGQENDKKADISDDPMDWDDDDLNELGFNQEFELDEEPVVEKESSKPKRPKPGM